MTDLCTHNIGNCHKSDNDMTSLETKKERVGCARSNLISSIKDRHLKVCSSSKRVSFCAPLFHLLKAQICTCKMWQLCDVTGSDALVSWRGERSDNSQLQPRVPTAWWSSSFHEKFADGDEFGEEGGGVDGHCPCNSLLPHLLVRHVSSKVSQHPPPSPLHPSFCQWVCWNILRYFVQIIDWWWYYRKL